MILGTSTETTGLNDMTTLPVLHDPEGDFLRHTITATLTTAALLTAFSAGIAPAVASPSEPAVSAVAAAASTGTADEVTRARPTVESPDKWWCRLVPCEKRR